MLNYYKNIITKSEFTKNTFTLMAGTIIAQIVPFAITPVLTRIYTPEEFGLFSLYISIVNVMAIIATCRYELAIMLPKKESDASNLFILSITLILVFTIITYIIIGFFKSFLIKIFNIQSGEWWIYLIPVSFLLVASYSVMSYWLNREKEYKRLSASLIVLKVSTEAVKFLIGFFDILKNGLMIGFALGHVIVNLVFGIKIFRKGEITFLNAKYKDIILSAIHYKQFPMYNMPYSLIGTFSGSFIIFAFTYFNYIESAGYFGLTRTLLLVPVTLMSSSLGRVFFKEASENIGNYKLEKLFSDLANLIIKFSIPGIIFFIFWAPFLFKIIFGERWEMAGIYASIYSPVIFLFLLTNWPIRIFEVCRKQRLSLIIQIIVDGVSIITILLLLNFNFKPVYVITAYSVISIIYHVILLHFIVKISSFKSFKLYKFSLKIFKWAIPLLLLMFVVFLISTDKLVLISIHACIILIYYFIILKFF